jgi:polysaccharide export outer membrane protein
LNGRPAEKGEARPLPTFTKKDEGPMKESRRPKGRRLAAWILWGLCAAGLGCGGTTSQPQEAPIPRELRMTTLPPYVIEPSDILLVTTMRVIPKPPYHVQPMDSLLMQATGTLSDKELNGLFPIEPGGTINLGPIYGTLRVAGMSIEETQKAVQDHLAKTLKPGFRVTVSLGQSRGMQAIQGPHIVRQDGTIGMGIYGSVYIAGMTIDEARRAVELHLSQFVLQPEINLDVYSYNTKWYYIIQDRAGYGQTVMRMPITGRETILDALSMIYGTFYMASNRHIWLARPNGQDPKQMQIFPVNWAAITEGGSPETNYQLMPGDRIYVQSNALIKLNNRMTQVFAPINNLFGFTLLGTSTVSTVQGTIQQFQNGFGGVGGGGGFR